MKKLVISMLFAGLLAACPVVLTSCGDDEPSNGGSSIGNTNSSIASEVTLLGTWRTTDESGTTELTFNKSGNFAKTVKHIENEEVVTESYNGTFIYDDVKNSLTMRYSNNDGTFTSYTYGVVLTATQLTLTDQNDVSTVYQKFITTPSLDDTIN